MKSIVTAPTSSVESARELKNRQLARVAATEGIVLLENNGVLPLKNKSIALFGGGARRTITGGTGSGAMHERYSVSIEEGLLNAGFEIDSKQWLDKYDAFYEKTYKDWHDGIEKLVEGIQNPMEALGLKKQHEFQYPTGMAISEQDLTDAQTAIYVIARQAGEADDRKLIKGDYYLDDTETANLKKLVHHYQDVIVVINSGGPVDLGAIEELDIAGLLFYSQAGQEGGNAFADLVSGTVTPSGKLSNTWAMEYTDYPSAGIFSTESDPLVQDYLEDIYVGYRYFDTFNKQPRYPFGYGLSYTTFEIEAKHFELVDEEVKHLVTVTNTGTHKGKEVVQVYVSLPSVQGTEYQRLVAFAKTSELKPGESEELELTYSLRDITIYDEEQASYKLIPGNYLSRIGTSTRSTKVSGKITVNREIVTEICTNINPLKKEMKTLVAPSREEEVVEVPTIVLEHEVKKMKHSYEELPLYITDSPEEMIEKMTVEDLATLVVGGGITGTRLVNAVGASGSTTSLLYEKYGIPNIILSDGPAGLNLTPELVQKPTGEILSTQLYEQYNFGSFREFMKRRLGKPEDGQMHYQYATAWPASILLAQTWNTELLYEVGKATGVEMEEFGVTIWLAPGMNIQRNPLGGRTFEYYSEDPVLTGMIAAAITNGVQSNPGKGVSIKHFAANNSEVMRHYSSSNMSERALREIYLRGFEIAVKQAQPYTVMAAYNKINDTYCTNNHDLLVKVLRNEWGYQGVVLSDWESIHPEKGDILKAHFSQCDLVTPGTPEQVQDLIEGVATGQVNLNDLKRSGARILRLIQKNTIIKVGR